MNIPSLIKKLIARQDLTEDESFAAITAMLSGTFTEGQIGAYLATLSAKGETIAEIAGAARAMRAAATRVQSLASNTLDTVGTGGDGGITFNISTTVAFVAAGAGATVAKHGNRASSGKSGSADCLECLGFNLNAAPELMEQALNEIGITFMFAPSFHKAMRFAGPVRKQLGVRTLFNLLGPLTNPAGAQCQVLGVYREELTEKLAQVLRRLGCRRGFVVHGLDGMDELTTTTETRIAEVTPEGVSSRLFKPEELGIPRTSMDELRGGDASANAAIVREVLSGEKGPKRDIVLLNAAFCLVAAGKTADPAEGLVLAAEAIDSGRAMRQLERLVELTNE